MPRIFQAASKIHKALQRITNLAYCARQRSNTDNTVTGSPCGRAASGHELKPSPFQGESLMT